MRSRTVEEIVLPDHGNHLTQIAAVDLDVAIIGQPPAAQLPLHDQLEPRPLEMEGFHTPLGRRRLIEEMLKDPPGDPHGAFVLADDDAELDAIAVIVPGHIFGKCEKHSGSPGKEAMMFPYCSIMPEYAEQEAEVDGMAVQRERIAGGFILITGIDGIRYAVRGRASGLILDETAAITNGAADRPAGVEGTAHGCLSAAVRAAKTTAERWTAKHPSEPYSPLKCRNYMRRSA